MRLALVAACVAACSPSPHPIAPPPVVAVPRDLPATAPAAEPAAPAGTDDAPAADPAAELGWAAHRCTARVSPYYPPWAPGDDDAARDQQVAEARSGHSEVGGTTLDQKLAELNRTLPSAGVCDVRNRAPLAASLLRLPTPRRRASSIKAWDRVQPPAYRDEVTGALALDAGELAQLARDGFVVPARLAYDDYTAAYYDIHRGELPVYVTADSILHAIFASHDQLVAAVEKSSLIEQLDRALGAMHCGLAAAAARYPRDVADDADLYLTIARSLLAGGRVPSELGKIDREAAQLVARIEAGGAIDRVALFGRDRAIDLGQFVPRGHYAGDPELERYFRAAMWLARTELNLVSRDTRSSQPGYDPDPRETPREAVLGLALADLASRTAARAPLAALDAAWTAFAGPRDDVSLDQLGQLRAAAHLVQLTAPEVADRLRAQIGDRFVRTVNVHPNPSVAHLPVITSLLGARLTSDFASLATLIDGRGPELSAGELAFMLGHDRGAAYADRAPEVAQRMARARDQLVHRPHTDDLYSHWLAAIEHLADRPDGVVPTFMDGAAFQDLRMASALTAYGQLRHNHVLITAHLYDQGGCEIPDGYVEPALETYRALADYAHRARSVFAALDRADASHGGAYFARLERLMATLVALSREELAGRPLSAEARRFLAMIVERRVARAAGYNNSYPVATWDGWYLDLFPAIDVAFKSPAFIADYATFDRNGVSGIHYLGAHGPRLGVFVVDAGGAPRMMVGPVATGFAHTGRVDAMVTDDTVDQVAGSAPWAASYTVPAPAAPALALAFRRTPPASDRNALRSRRRVAAPGEPLPPPLALPPDVIRIESAAAHDDVVLELLDHHFRALATIRARVGAGRTDVAVAEPARPVEAVRITVGAFHGRLDLGLGGTAAVTFGGDPALGNQLAIDASEAAEGIRPRFGGELVEPVPPPRADRAP